MVFTGTEYSGAAGSLAATATPNGLPARTSTSPYATQLQGHQMEQGAEASSSSDRLASRDFKTYSNNLYIVSTPNHLLPSGQGLPLSFLKQSTAQAAASPPRPAGASVDIATPAVHLPAAPRTAFCLIMLTLFLTLTQIICAKLIIWMVGKLGGDRGIAGRTAMVAGAVTMVLNVLHSVLKAFLPMGAAVLRVLLVILWLIAAILTTVALEHGPPLAAHLVSWCVDIAAMSWVLCMLCIAATPAEAMLAALPSTSAAHPGDVEAGKE